MVNLWHFGPKLKGFMWWYISTWGLKRKRKNLRMRMQMSMWTRGRQNGCSNRRILWSRTAVRKSYQPYCNLMHLLWMIGEDTELKRVKHIYLVIITFRNKHPFYTAYLPYFSFSSFQAGNKRGFSSCLQNEYYQSSCVSFVLFGTAPRAFGPLQSPLVFITI